MGLAKVHITSRRQSQDLNPDPVSRLRPLEVKEAKENQWGQEGDGPL